MTKLEFTNDNEQWVLEFTKDGLSINKKPKGVGTHWVYSFGWDAVDRIHDFLNTHVTRFDKIEVLNDGDENLEIFGPKYSGDSFLNATPGKPIAVLGPGESKWVPVGSEARGKARILRARRKV